MTPPDAFWVPQLCDAEISMNRSPLYSAFAALGGVALAASCCLPLPAILAAGSLGAASAWLPEARPYLMAASLAALAFGFYRLYSKKHCERRGPVAQGVLWISLLATLAFLLFPQKTAQLLAGPVPTARTAAPLPIADLDIASLKQAFNAAAGETRVIALLSPT